MRIFGFVVKALHFVIKALGLVRKVLGCVQRQFIPPFYLYKRESQDHKSLVSLFDTRIYQLIADLRVKSAAHFASTSCPWQIDCVV